MEVLIPLIDEVPQNFKNVIGTELQEILTKTQNTDEYWNLQHQANENLKLLNRHQLVKKMEEKWPNSPDLKAFSFKINPKKFTSDDQIYQNSPVLLKILPRGLVYVDNKLTIFGFPKFFGLRHGDDDHSHQSTEVDPNATKLIISQKANGEMAQIYWYTTQNSKEYECGWIIGSKNRKIFVTTVEDLVHYDGNPIYKFSIIIAHEWFKILNQIDDEKIKNLKEFLDLTNFTMIWELQNINSQHLEVFDQNDLVLIGISSIDHPFGLHPIFTYALAKYLNNRSCVIKNPMIFSVLELDYCSQRVSEDSWGNEGAVFYLMDDTDKVIQMIKVKSWWYILLRAIREKLRSNLKTCSALLCGDQIRRRLSVIETDMKISNVWIDKFKILGCSFAVWFFQQFNHNDDNSNILEEFTERYPMLWLRFLKENALPSDHSLLKVDLSKLKKMINNTLQPALLVMFQGIPGLGKNYLSERLKMQLIKSNLSAMVVSQDDFFYLGMQKSGQACFDHVTKLIYSGKHNIIFLARNNSNRQQYKRYLKFPRIIFIAPEEIRTKFQELTALGLISILQRKNSSENHPTNSLSNTALASLPFKFGAGFNYYQTAFRIEFLKKDAYLSADERQMIGLEINRFRRAKNPFNEKDIEDYLINSMDSEKILKFRRSIHEIMYDCIDAIRLGLRNQVPLEGQYLAIIPELDSITKKKWDDLLEFYPGQKGPMEIVLIRDRNFQDDKHRWIELSQIIGKEYSIVISRFKQKLDRLVVAEISLGDGLDDEIYGPGPPYLIMKISPKGKMNEALNLLKNNDISWIVLENPIVMTGKIELLSNIK